jgi:phage FluMu protein Com
MKGIFKKSKGICKFCGSRLYTKKIKKGYMTMCLKCGGVRIFHSIEDKFTCNHLVKEWKKGKGFIMKRCPACGYIGFYYPVKNETSGFYEKMLKLLGGK